MAKAKGTREEGAYEEPDLVPIMNLVCVLIPLILWTTTWVTFGQITILRGSGDSAGKGQKSDDKKLRLVAVVSLSSITLMAGREVASIVMPDDPSGGGTQKGRVDIPHITITVAEAQAKKQGCKPPNDPKNDFDECVYWSYVLNFLNICYQAPQGAVRMPDLMTLNMHLREIKKKAMEDPSLGRERLDDIDQLNVKAEDDVPYCQIVGLMDLSRFRVNSFNWSLDENAEFRDHMADLIASKVNDPFLDPTKWNDAMKRELLFPIIGFAN